MPFDKARLAGWADPMRALAANGHRVSFDGWTVRVTGERAESAFTTTGRHPSGFRLTWGYERTLRRTPAGWRVTGGRDWPVAQKVGAELTEYTPAYYREKDAAAAKATAAGKPAEAVRALLDSRRHKDAIAAARAEVAKPGATAEDHLRHAEAAVQVGEPAEVRAAFRAALKLKPDLETPWFLTRRLAGFPTGGEVLYGLALHPTTTAFAAGGGAAKLYTGDTAARTASGTASGHTEAISDVKYSPDGKTVATVGNDGRLKLFPAGGGKAVWSVQAHPRMGFRLAFRPDGKRIATCGIDHAVRVFDTADGSPVRELAGHTDAVYGVAWSPDGKRLASASADRTARVWDPGTGAEVLSLPGNPKGAMRVAYSPDGKALATSGLDGRVRFWDAATGQPRPSPGVGHAGTAEPVAFTPDDKTLVSGGTRDGAVMVWDVPTGRLREVIRACPGGGVYALAVSPDGKRLVTGATDGTIAVWTLEDW